MRKSEKGKVHRALCRHRADDRKQKTEDFEVGSRNAEVRRLRTDDTGQMTENRRQRTEDRRHRLQRIEVGKRNAEVGRLRTDNRGRKTEGTDYRKQMTDNRKQISEDKL